MSLSHVTQSCHCSWVNPLSLTSVSYSHLVRIHLWWILLFWPLFLLFLGFQWLWAQNYPKNHTCSPSQKTQIWPNFFDLDLIFKVTEVIKVKILKISKFNILLNLEYFWKPFWFQGCTLVLQVSDRYWLKLVTGNLYN